MNKFKTTVALISVTLMSASFGFSPIALACGANAKAKVKAKEGRSLSSETVNKKNTGNQEKDEITQPVFHHMGMLENRN